MFCSDWTLVKHTPHSVVISPLLCKCWTCDTCRPMRKANLVKEAQAGKPNRFITLTSRRTAGGSPHLAAQALVIAWRTIRAEYIKKHGKGSLAFLAVFENTKQGWPHLHILVRSKYIEQRWLSKRMGELTEAPIVDIRKVSGEKKVSYYIAKYIGKNPWRFAGTKRYWRSLSYLFPVPDIEEDDDDDYCWYTVSKFKFGTALDTYIGIGYTAVFERNRCVLTPPRPP